MGAISDTDTMCSSRCAGGGAWLVCVEANTTYEVSVGLFTDEMEGELTSWTVHTPPLPPAPSVPPPPPHHSDVTPATSSSSSSGTRLLVVPPQPCRTAAFPAQHLRPSAVA